MAGVGRPVLPHQVSHPVPKRVHVGLYGWRLDVARHERGEAGTGPRRAGVRALGGGMGDVHDVLAIHEVLDVGRQALELVVDDGVHRVARRFVLHLYTVAQVVRHRQRRFVCLHTGATATAQLTTNSTACFCNATNKAMCLPAVKLWF